MNANLHVYIVALGLFLAGPLNFLVPFLITCGEEAEQDDRREPPSNDLLPHIPATRER